jgi:hypothetical protein
MNNPFQPQDRPGSNLNLQSPIPTAIWNDELDEPFAQMTRHASANRVHESTGSMFARLGGCKKNYMSNSNFSFFNKMGQPKTTRSGWNPNLLISQ